MIWLATSLIKLFHLSHCVFVDFRRTEILFEEFFKLQLFFFVYPLYRRGGSQGFRDSYSNIVGTVTAINTMKGNDIWCQGSWLLEFNIDMWDSFAMLACVVLIWLVTGKGFRTTLALVVPVPFGMLAFTFNRILIRVRERSVLQLGWMARPFWHSWSSRELGWNVSSFLIL